MFNGFKKHFKNVVNFEFHLKTIFMKLYNSAYKSKYTESQ